MKQLLSILLLKPIVLRQQYRRCHIVCLFILACNALYAQKQNNTWCFSRRVGVDFNSSTPSVFLSGCNANEGGGATVSSRYTGQLLFYTDGVKIWDRTHKVMPNGINVGTDPILTSAQASLIIPYIDDSNKYYVFTKEEQLSANGTLYASTVDMTLNGGLGDVVAGQNKIAIDTGFSEGMTYTTKAACPASYWLLLSRRNSHEFITYRITKTGIVAVPVVSTLIFPQHVVQPGNICMKISPDNKRILYSVHDCNLNNYPDSVNTSFVAMYDFDELTGKVSNCRIIESPTLYGTYYGCAFSPDGSKAYIGNFRTREIYQYDALLTTASAIKASRQTLYTATMNNRRPGDLQLGPDNNIYIAFYNTGLDKISNCNSSTPTYTAGAVAQPPGAVTTFSLPQSVLYLPAVKDSFTLQTDTICNGEPIKLGGRDTATEYKWQDGSSMDTFIATGKGTYWVSSIVHCVNYIDTFNVREVDMQFNIPDTSICAGDKGILLSAPKFVDSATYLWNTGSTNNNITVTEPGVYHVTARSGQCADTDSIQVSEDDGAVFDLGQDTVLCAGVVYNLKGPANVDSYSWSTGSEESSVDIGKEGGYSLFVQKGACNYSDSINARFEDGNIRVDNDTTICYGDSLTVKVRSLEGSEYNWYNGWKEPMITLTQPGVYWVSATNRCGIFRDTVKVDFDVCKCNYFVPTAFTPNGDGLNDKIAPIVDCPGAKYNFKILNRFGQIVFASTNTDEKWDGMFNRQHAELGTYFYLLQLITPTGKEIQNKGDITLIR